GDDGFPHLALDLAGNVYASFIGAEQRYPTTPGAFQPHFGGGNTDAIVAKLDPTGSSLIYATYLGGGGDDIPGHVAVDAAGDVFVVGGTDSTDFPVTPDAFQPTNYGSGDGVIAELSADGSHPIFSTYWGGTDVDAIIGSVLDAYDNLFVTGCTQSTDYPVTSGA